MARNKMNERTEGLKNFVQQALNQLREGNIKEAEYTLMNLVDDIGMAYVCKMNKPKTISPVGNYDSKTDGNYSDWLVANNID
jgi:hypothetical protein